MSYQLVKSLHQSHNRLCEVTVEHKAVRYRTYNKRHGYKTALTNTNSGDHSRYRYHRFIFISMNFTIYIRSCLTGGSYSAGNA